MNTEFILWAHHRGAQSLPILGTRIQPRHQLTKEYSLFLLDQRTQGAAPTQPQGLANLPDCVSTAMVMPNHVTGCSFTLGPGSFSGSPVWLQSWTRWPPGRAPPRPTRGSCLFSWILPVVSFQTSLVSENLFSGAKHEDWKKWLLPQMHNRH